MFNSLTGYQIYKYLEKSLTEDKNNNYILEPLCVIFKLAILQYKPKNTKLSIKNNSIHFQEPSYDQGIIRKWEGDSREDLHNLYHPILKSIEWYDSKDEDFKFLYSESISGLCELNSVYDNNSTIKHTISHYISVIQFNDNDEYKKKIKFNPIIDSLKEIWTKDEIKSAISLLYLINTNKNRELYIKSLELIIDDKEKFVYNYLNEISSQYQS